MKAITLWNPYSTLAALGEKGWETRPYRMAVGTVLAIHSSKTMPRDAALKAASPDFQEALAGAPLIHGSILAVVTVKRVISTKQWIREHCQRGKITMRNRLEYLFGDYGPKRFAWQMGDRHRLASPIPCKGAQGPWKVPPDIEAMIHEQLNAGLRGAGAVPQQPNP